MRKQKELWENPGSQVLNNHFILKDEMNQLESEHLNHFSLTNCGYFVFREHVTGQVV